MIECKSAADWNSNRWSSNLIFSTTPNSDSSTTNTRLTIDSQGRLQQQIFKQGATGILADRVTCLFLQTIWVPVMSYLALVSVQDLIS